MKRALFHIRVEFDLLKTAGRTNALFITRGDIARRDSSGWTGFCALENNDIAGHGKWKSVG